MSATQTSDCRHRVRMRLLGADARLWQCAGDTSITPADPGCAALFVEGRTWEGETAWIPTGKASVAAFKCTHCLDGFCTSLDHKACQVCGRTTARPVAVAYQEEVRQDSILRGGMPDADEE